MQNCVLCQKKKKVQSQHFILAFVSIKKRLKRDTQEANHDGFLFDGGGGNQRDSGSLTIPFYII